jgi:hypothetical protein
MLVMALSGVGAAGTGVAAGTGAATGTQAAVTPSIRVKHVNSRMERECAFI